MVLASACAAVAAGRGAGAGSADLSGSTLTVTLAFSPSTVLMTVGGGDVSGFSGDFCVGLDLALDCAPCVPPRGQRVNFSGP